MFLFDVVQPFSSVSRMPPVVRALEDAGLLQDVEGFSGTSAGSQAAALLAAGFTGAEMAQSLLDIEVSTGKHTASYW